MNQNEMLVELIRKRRSERKFNGLAPDDLKEDTEVVMGEGASEKNQEHALEKGSSDELAPSREEAKRASGEKTEEEEIFDERIYEGAKKKPEEQRSMFENMMIKIAEKLGKNK